MKDYTRTERVSLLIQKNLAGIIQKSLRDPRLPSLITVSEVSISRDLAYAKIYITTLSEPTEEAEILKILNHATSFLRRELSRQTQLRITPKLRFLYDSSSAYGQHIDRLLENISVN